MVGLSQSISYCTGLTFPLKGSPSRLLSGMSHSPVSLGLPWEAIMKETEGDFKTPAAGLAVHPITPGGVGAAE